VRYSSLAVLDELEVEQVLLRYCVTQEQSTEHRSHMEMIEMDAVVDAAGDFEGSGGR